jgi:hypothetical protein
MKKLIETIHNRNKENRQIFEINNNFDLIISKNIYIRRYDRIEYIGLCNVINKLNEFDESLQDELRFKLEEIILLGT